MPSIKQEKGKKYEDFSRNILLLKEISWDKGIVFDTVSDNHNGKIEGISGVKHQIDIHLLSSKNHDYHLLCECKSYNGPVEKTEACSFVTVIKDIKEQHKEWKIIPCFASNLGFQSGAAKVLAYYDIAPLDLQNVSEKQIKLTITESSIRPDIVITAVYLRGDILAKRYDGFKNDERGEILSPNNLLGFYELFDQDNKLIDDIVNYKGTFKTGRRINVLSEYDVFKSLDTGLELGRIEGISRGPIKSESHTSTSIIKSDINAVLRIDDKLLYRFKKDGSIDKIDYSIIQDKD